MLSRIRISPNLHKSSVCDFISNSLFQLESVADKDVVCWEVVLTRRNQNHPFATLDNGLHGHEALLVTVHKHLPLAVYLLEPGQTHRSPGWGNITLLDQRAQALGVHNSVTLDLTIVADYAVVDKVNTIVRKWVGILITDRSMRCVSRVTNSHGVGRLAV